jgi:hypothetical protein
MPLVSSHSGTLSLKCNDIRGMMASQALFIKPDNYYLFSWVNASFQSYIELCSERVSPSSGAEQGLFQHIQGAHQNE